MMGDVADDYYDAEMCENDKDDECPTCHGSGLVNPLTRVRAKDFLCFGTTDCPDCDGTGIIQ